ncbi:MAG: serine/threonine-protein kinase [Polyangiaceae bacterium]
MHGRLADGGMATVHIGRAVSGASAGRLLAIKQLGAELSSKPAFVAMFLDEARIAARIRHANVVATLDVLENEGDLFQILEYVSGETLARVQRCAAERRRALPLPIVSAIVGDALRGLDGAHRTRAGDQSMCIVHRDVSPQNIIVGVDGAARLLDFGVAKSEGRVHWTVNGEVKGKLGYIAPEQLSRDDVTLRADIYSMGVVLWELLVGRKLRVGGGPTVLVQQALLDVPPPSSVASGLGPDLDALIGRACAVDPEGRFASAANMADALARVLPPAPAREVARYMADVAGEALEKRSQLVRSANLEATAQDARAVATTRPPPPDAKHRHQVLRAATRPYTARELDEDSLSLAGFTPRPEPSPRAGDGDSVRGVALGSPVPAAVAGPSPRPRRGLRSNVFYPVAPPAPGAAVRPEPPIEEPRVSRDEMAASNFPLAASASGVPVDWSLPNARVRRADTGTVGGFTPGGATPRPLATPPRDRADAAASPSGWGRVAASVPAVLAAAALALALSFTVAPRGAANGPRTAYAWIGPYLRNAGGLAGITQRPMVLPAATAPSGEPR